VRSMENVRYCCEECAPKPDESLEKIPNEVFLKGWVKFTIQVDEEKEHVWGRVVGHRDNYCLTVALDNEPRGEKVKAAYKLGERLLVDKTRLIAFISKGAQKGD
jgi:hypothetical protein